MSSYTLLFFFKQTIEKQLNLEKVPSAMSRRRYQDEEEEGDEEQHEDHNEEESYYDDETHSRSHYDSQYGDSQYDEEGNYREDEPSFTGTQSVVSHGTSFADRDRMGIAVGSAAAGYAAGSAMNNRQAANTRGRRGDSEDDENDEENDSRQDQRRGGGDGGEERKKKPRDYSDNYGPHRLADQFPPVVLPKKAVDMVLPDCRQEAIGAAHKHCFTFFGYGERRTTHKVKKQKAVLVLMSYESITVCDASRGELLRIIPINEILSPINYVLDENILHIKVNDEHDLVVRFINKPQPPSERVDTLCDKISDLQFCIREDELPAGESPDMIERLEVFEIATSAQLYDVQLKRPPHVRYPVVRMKELLRYENPDVDDGIIQIPENAVRQIPPTLEEIPQREETFVTVLPEIRLDDLQKRLQLRTSLLNDKERELEILRQGNDFLRSEQQALTASIQTLRTQVQIAYRDAENALKKTRVKRRTRPPPRQQQQQQQMKWERGSDEEEVDDDFNGSQQRRRQQAPSEDAPQELEGYDEYDDGQQGDENDEGSDEEHWDDEDHDASVSNAVALNDKKALNAAVLRESLRVFKRLKVVKLKLLQAQEQAARLWTRTDCASETISAYEDVLLRLEFIAEEAAISEAGASEKKQALEVKNRSLKLEYQALKLLDRVSDTRDARLVKAETELALRRRDLEDKANEEDRLLEDQVRPIRIENERHIAELTAFFDAELAKVAAMTAVEFRHMHEDSRKRAQETSDPSLSGRAKRAVLEKVEREARESNLLREELQKKAAHLTHAIVSLKDENEGLKGILNDVMQEYGLSTEAQKELQTRLLDAQRGLADERDVRKEILEKTKHQIVAHSQEVLRQKEEEITRARRSLFEIQDSLQRAAKTFGMGDVYRNTARSTLSLQ